MFFLPKANPHRNRMQQHLNRGCSTAIGRPECIRDIEWGFSGSALQYLNFSAEKGFPTVDPYKSSRYRLKNIIFAYYLNANYPILLYIYLWIFFHK
jgi:hypothetical protein